MTDSCLPGCLMEMTGYGPTRAWPPVGEIFWCGYGGLNRTPTLRHGKKLPGRYHAIAAWLEPEKRRLKLAVKRAEDPAMISSIEMDRFEQEWLKRMGDRPIPTGTGQSKDAVNVFWETVLLFLRA